MAARHVSMTVRNGPQGGHLLKTLPQRELTLEEINAPPLDSDDEEPVHENVLPQEAAEVVQTKELLKKKRPAFRVPFALKDRPAGATGEAEGATDVENKEDAPAPGSRRGTRSTNLKRSPKRTKDEVGAAEEEQEESAFAVRPVKFKKNLSYKTMHDRKALSTARAEKAKKFVHKQPLVPRKSFRAPDSAYTSRLQENEDKHRSMRPKFQVPAYGARDISPSSAESDKSDVMLPPANELEDDGPTDFSVLPISSSQDHGRKKFKPPRAIDLGQSPPRRSTRISKPEAEGSPGAGLAAQEQPRKGLINDMKQALGGDQFKKLSELSKKLDIQYPELDRSNTVNGTATTGSVSQSNDGRSPSPEPVVIEEQDTVPCPMCKEHIPAEILEAFDTGGRMRVRTQAKVCRAHRQRSAQEIWSARGYPDLDWDNLDKRLELYYPILNSMLDSKIPSHYRNALAAKVQKGKNRTLVQTMMGAGLDGLTPGYYGSKGARAMLEGIMDHFSEKIRQLAPQDKLIASGGVTGYVQSVLVPELAICLIKEDMSVGDERARHILEESVEIGDLLNEEDDEVVNLPVNDIENLDPLDAEGLEEQFYD